MNDLTTDQCRRLLAESAVAHLAVVADGEPYVSPISYVLREAAVCIRTGPGRRLDAIRSHPRVCLEVSKFDAATGQWESVIAWGEAEIVEDDRLAQAIIIDLIDKYRPAIGNPLSPPGAMPEPEVILRIPLDEVTGRTSGSLFSVRRRPGRL